MPILTENEVKITIVNKKSFNIRIVTLVALLLKNYMYFLEKKHDPGKGNNAEVVKTSLVLFFFDFVLFCETELKETMARVGADLKQRLIESVRSTWNTVYQLTTFGRADDGLEQEVDQVIEKQLERQQTENSPPSFNEYYDSDFNAGRLNQGRRIDYVLQEAPFESFIEYASAVRSHVIYW